MKRWRYATETVSGNMHAAVAYLNERHPEWDIITMDVVGNYTIIVYRTEVE